MLTLNCPECGGKTKREVGEYDVGHLVGLPSVRVKHLPAFVCPNRHDVVFEGRHLDAIMQRLAIKMVRDVDRLGGSEVRYLRKYLRETQEQFAKRIGTSRITVARWEGEPKKEIDAITSYAIRSVVAGVLSQRHRIKGLSLEPVALRQGHARPSGYRLDFERAA